MAATFVSPKEVKIEAPSGGGPGATDLSTSELEDSAVAMDETQGAIEVSSSPQADDSPLWPDESAESAFLAEQGRQGLGFTAPAEAAPKGTAEESDPDDSSGPLPSLDDLINRVPAQVREVLEDLFRARFVRVVRTKKSVLK